MQLQEVVDNSNILNIRKGNSGLKQELIDKFNLTYTNFDAATLKNVVIYLDGSLATNGITNATTINYTNDTIVVDNFKLGPGARFMKLVNIDGNLNIYSYLNYSFPIKSTKSNINSTTFINFRRDINLINNVKGNTDNYTIGETLRYTLNLQEKIDLNFSSSSTYNIARFPFLSNENRSYFVQQFTLESTYSTKKGWTIENYFNYLFNKGQSAAYNQPVVLLNANVSKQIFKKKEGELKLSVYDLLNQNNSFTRTITENQVQDSRSSVLERFFMLTFTYYFRKFGGAQKHN